MCGWCRQHAPADRQGDQGPSAATEGEPAKPVRVQYRTRWAGDEGLVPQNGPPDWRIGQTILLTYTGTLCINPTLYPNAGYDPRKDFAPIGLIGWQPSVLTVHPSLPVRTPSELVAYAKANPGKINYGFVPGTIGQMTTEMFARSTG